MSEVTPPPLQGCMFCHAEMAPTRSRGWGFPKRPTTDNLLTCTVCGAVAEFDEGDGTSSSRGWRLRYRKYPRSAPYIHAARVWGQAGWVDASSAMDLSLQCYYQRQRLRQCEAGDLSWLMATRLSPPPPLMSPDEIVFLTLKPATYRERVPTRLRPQRHLILDSGTFYVTNIKVHLLGQRRDRSHRLSEVAEVSFRANTWQIHLTDQPHFYQGEGQVGVMDAELISAILKAMLKQRGIPKP